MVYASESTLRYGYGIKHKYDVIFFHILRLSCFWLLLKFSCLKVALFELLNAVSGRRNNAPKESLLLFLWMLLPLLTKGVKEEKLAEPKKNLPNLSVPVEVVGLEP